MTRFLIPLIVSTVASVAVVEGFTTTTTNTAIASRRAAVRQQTTELFFGIPTFQKKEEDDEPEDPNLEKNKIGLGGLFQLITSGAGAPFLGEFQVRTVLYCTVLYCYVLYGFDKLQRQSCSRELSANRQRMNE